MEDNRTQFAAQSASILEVARQHPEWTFLVKVHPFEAVEPYRDLAERVPNLYVVKDVPVRNVLYHADVVIQRGCTTATEAWMLGKPVIDRKSTRLNSSHSSISYAVFCLKKKKKKK